MKKPILLHFALAACVLAVAAAPASAQGRKKPPANQEEKKEADPKAYEEQFPTKMNWVLSDINGKSPPTEGTMAIDENLRGTGTAGCNTWSAALYPVKGQKLAMGPVAQTKRTCPQDIMLMERMFLTILHTGPTWALKGSTLTVKSQAGTLVFNRGL